MMTNPKAPCKNSELFDKLNVSFGERMNLARIKFISLMILATGPIGSSVILISMRWC